MPNGYVYVLLNPALKGQVKIGKTTNSPEQRAAELSTTGIPHEFIVLYAERVSDCDTVERVLHERFADVRVSPNREFFRVTPQAAIRAVIEVAGLYRVDETVEAQNTGPDQDDILDEKTQERVREEKRIRRILLMRERSTKRQSEPGT
jgi:hypothetical protein